MSLKTYSKKRNRIYPRLFDHEEAQRLRAEGWTYTRLADHFDVSYEAVRRVCDPKIREKLDRHAREWIARHHRKPCKGGCGVLVWTHHKGRSGYCRACTGLLRSSADVRPTELRCRFCGEWKPDAEFGKGKARSRRYRRTECRACGTRIRREFRHNHREQEAATANIYYHEVRREKRGVMAEYVVLHGNGDKTYHEIDRVEALSPDAAIEKVAQDEGEYVAVVASRWDVVPVAPRTMLRVVRKEKE